jgi:hypothetical protein
MVLDGDGKNERKKKKKTIYMFTKKEKTWKDKSKLSPTVVNIERERVWEKDKWCFITWLGKRRNIYIYIYIYIETQGPRFEKKKPKRKSSNQMPY